MRPSVTLPTHFSRQTLGRFGRDLACSWIHHAEVGISKIRTTGHLHHHIKRAVRMSLFFTLSPISQQLLGRFGPNLAGRRVLSVALLISKSTMISHIVGIIYYKNRLCVCPTVEYRNSSHDILRTVGVSLFFTKKLSHCKADT